MHSVHKKMTVEEYHDFPWRIGCKHEYYGGRIHVTPTATALVTLRLMLREQTPADSPGSIRPLQAKDKRSLIALYRLTFRTAPEYTDWPLATFRERARTNIEAHLSECQQPWFSASHVVQEGNHLLAAALIEQTRKGPILQPIFVRPGHQRQGLGQALMQHVENRLLQLGAMDLYSHCHLANEASLAWHYRYGFTEIPDFGIAGHRRNFFKHELERRRRLQQITEQEIAELGEKIAYWDAEYRRLETIRTQDFNAAYPVMQLFHGND